MSKSSQFLTAARFAPIVSLGLGLLVVAGCGPPEAGSIELPEELKRSGPMGYGPTASKGASPGLGPGDFRPAPKAATAKARSKTSRPLGR